MKQVGKSKEMLRQEARLQELQQERKKIQTTIKSLRTRLQNTKAKVEELSREVLVKSEEVRNKTSEFLRRVSELLARMREDNRFSQNEKLILEELYLQFHGEMEELMFDIDPENVFDEFEEFMSMFEDWPGGEEDGKSRDRLYDKESDVRPQPAREEKKDMRKLYLALSKRLHPDRAKDASEEAVFHKLQLRVNEAYERHDYQVLLELWQMYCLEEASELKDGPEQYDVMLAQIERLERECELLASQKERLSEEIYELRHSELGKMLSFRDSNPFEDVEELFGIRDSEQRLEPLMALLEQLEESDKKGRLHPTLMDLMGENHGIEEEELFQKKPPPPVHKKKEPKPSDDGSIQLSLFDDLPEGQTKTSKSSEVPANTLHKIGDYVSIFGEAILDYYDDENRLRTLGVKNLKGWVFDFGYNEHEVEHEYHINLDLASFRKLPEFYVRKMLFDEIFQADQVLYVPEGQVKKVSKTKWPNKRVTMEAVRRAQWEYLLDPNMDSEIRDLMLNVVMPNPEISDYEKWKVAIQTQFSFPYEAIALYSEDIQHDTPVSVVGFTGEPHPLENDFLMWVLPKGSRKRVQAEFYHLTPTNQKLYPWWLAFRFWNDRVSPF